MVPLGLIVFDCDGVLVDSEPLSMRILLQTIAEAGVEIDAADGYEAFLGKSLATVCDQLRREHRIDMDAAALERMRRQLYQSIREELQPIPGIADALARLSQPLCVASSSQLERIGLSLEVTGLTRHFAGNVFSASMVRRGKPAPDLFLYAAERMSVAPTDCIVVEDSPAGITAALEAGMAVLGFAGGSHARSEAHQKKLSALGPLAVFDDMRELPGLIQGLGQGRKVS